MNRVTRISLLASTAYLLAMAIPAEAQWVFLARKTIGKVKEMTQTEKTGGPGYSVATVMVNGQGEKVYAAALKSVQASEKVRLTKSDPERLTLEFSDGPQVVGLQITQVGENVTNLVIASATPQGKPDETSIVVSAALRICKQMGAECSLGKPEPPPQGTPANPAPTAPPR